jgi:competence protein ComEC
MWIFSLCCLFFILFSPLTLVSFFSRHFVFLQQWCFDSMPVGQADGILWQALVCAKEFPSENHWKSSLQITGLIHLFVVSGSHFIVLQWLLQKLRTPRAVQILVLWFYNAATGFSAPGTRACISISCSFLFKIRSEQRVWAVALICLALEPTWCTSYSFWLSWLASLILIVSPQMKLNVIRNSLFYFVWILLGFSLSVWSIPMNILMGPFVSWILFPLAFLSYIPGVEVLFHWGVQVLDFALSRFHSEPHPFPLQFLQLAGLVILTHMVLQLRRLQWRGKKIM